MKLVRLDRLGAQEAGLTRAASPYGEKKAGIAGFLDSLRYRKHPLDAAPVGVPRNEPITLTVNAARSRGLDLAIDKAVSIACPVATGHCPVACAWPLVCVWLQT